MENKANGVIALKGGAYYVTNDPDTAYRVLRGTVFVYVAPIKKNAPGRRELVYEAATGETIPSLAFTDGEHNTWRFCFTAQDEAQLGVIEFGSGRPLKKAFAMRAGIPNFDRQGFESGLVDLYNMKIAKEYAYLIKAMHNRTGIIEQTDNLIISEFGSKDAAAFAESGSDHALYNCLHFVCSAAKTRLAPFDEIKQSAGKDFAVEDAARVSGFPYREVLLDAKWYKSDAGYFIAFTLDGHEPVACIPRGRSGYTIIRSDGKREKATKSAAEKIDPKAYMIYRPFEPEPVSVKKLIKFCAGELKTADIVTLVIMTLITSLVGILMPFLNQKLYDKYIYIGDYSLILGLGALIAAFTVGNVFFSISKSIASFRIGSRVKLSTQNAVYHRIFELPEHFSRKYESADLTGRTLEVGEIAGSTVSMVFSTAVTVVSLIVYLCMMFSYSGKMTWISLIASVVYAALMIWISGLKVKRQAKLLEMDGKTNSVMYQLLSGIAKLRMAGTEDRALYEFMKPFVKERVIANNISKTDAIGSVIGAMGASIINILLYITVFNSSDISTGSFIAFTSAFGMTFGAISSLVDSASGFMMIRPSYDRIKPVLEASPENEAGKLIPKDITGDIDVDHVTFAYSEEEPVVINDLSLHISAGEYVGIVGGSGCGKSTLFKLLLGFEKPVLGKIYYSSQDMEMLDLKELRKNLGVVLQDGKLIAGSIFDNITIACPGATMEKVQQVVEEVGLKDDIDAMPMGLHTVLSEDASTVSGGQQQRILIARAIINRPKILFFDEATSALDNITQNMVCESLEKMHSTRVVIAHRLSTIKNCDRIIVLDNGNIAEQGTYEELMQMNGLFRELADRQIM